MEHDARLFRSLPSVMPAVGLVERILCAVNYKRRQILRMRLAITLTGLSMGLAYVVYRWTEIWEELGHSSFIEMARLWFTDPDVMLANVNEAVLGALEFIPWGTVTLVLVLLLCAVGSIGFMQALRKNAHSALLERFI